MIRGQVMVDGLVELDASLFNVHFEEFMDVKELDVFMSIPFLQTKPGRIVGVPSFG
jgi:hypothetical protein